MVAAVVAAPSLGLAFVSPVTAQTGGCSRGLGAAFVEISSPFQGESVSGEVAVRARATSLLGLTRAELLVNGSMIDSRSLSNQLDASISFTWDSSLTPPGLATLRVIVCGAGGQLGPYGESSVSVDVRGAAPTTTTPETTVPGTVAPPGGSVPTTVAGSAPTSTAVAPTTTAAPTTTSTTAPPVEAPAEPPPSIAIESEPRALIINEGDDGGSGSLPIWVGGVVGVSGLAGLAVSLSVRGRRPPPVPPLPAAAEPAEPVLARD